MLNWKISISNLTTVMQITFPIIYKSMKHTFLKFNKVIAMINTLISTNHSTCYVNLSINQNKHKTNFILLNTHNSNYKCLRNFVSNSIANLHIFILAMDIQGKKSILEFLPIIYLLSFSFTPIYIYTYNLIYE